MSDQLTLRFRPRRFSDMIGNRLNSIVLQQMVDTSTVPNALLFAGPRGTGKTSAARILATELNPDERESILTGASLSVIEIDAASNGSVADIRSLVEQLRYSVGSGTRVVILDEAHSITRDGFNALLKTLEEPPAGVIFVLVTTEVNKLPDTILSRVTEFEFRRVSPEDILNRLSFVRRSLDLSTSDDVLVLISQSADGSVRDAIKTLDFVARAGLDSVDQYVEFYGMVDLAPNMLKALATNDHALIFDVLGQFMSSTGDARTVADSITQTITDIFILKSGGEITASGGPLLARVELAKSIPSESLYLAVQVLWDLRTKIRQTDDQRTALAMALIIVADKLSGGAAAPAVIRDTEPPIVVASKVEDPRPLSISEIMQS